MPVYRQLIVKYGADVTEAIGGIERVNKAVEVSGRAFDQSFGSISSKARSIGTGLTIGVTAPLVLAGKAAIDANMRFDSLQRGMSAVTGSAGLAAIEFSRLREVAKLPGLGYEEALRGSINLQAAGMSADMAARSLMAFGNALATVGRGKDALEYVNIALTQLMNRSSGFGQEIRQLQNWLPQIRQAMKGAFGTTDSEAISKSGITGAQFVEAITKELEKLPRMTGGVRNSFENMSDAINRSMAKAGNALEGPVVQIAGVIEKLADGFEKLDKADQQLIVGFGALLAVAGPAIVAGTNLWSAWKTATSVAELLAIAKKADAAATKAATQAAIDAANAALAEAEAKKLSGNAISQETELIILNTAAKEANLATLRNLMGIWAQYANMRNIPALTSSAIQPGVNWRDYQAPSAPQAALPAPSMTAIQAYSPANTAIQAYTSSTNAAVAATGKMSGIMDTLKGKASGALNVVVDGAKSATTAVVGFGAKAAVALAPFALVAVIGAALHDIYKNWQLVNSSLESQNNTIDDLNRRLDEYQKRLERLSKISPDNPNPREKLQKEVNDRRRSDATLSADVDNNEWKRGQDRFERNAQQAENGGWLSKTRAEVARRVKGVIDDAGFRGSGGGNDYDIAVKQRDENKQKLQAAIKALKDYDAQAAADKAFQAATKPIEDAARKWQMAAVKAAQKGDEAGKAWADIEYTYNKKLADNAAAAAKDPAFDKAYADMLAREEYKADKAKYFWDKAEAAQKKKKEASEKAAEEKRKSDEKAAEAFRQFRSEQFAVLDQRQMQAASKREKYEAAIQDEKDPSKRADMASKMAKANYEVAAIDALKAYTSELDSLNEAKAKGIDVTQRLAAAQMKYRNSMEVASRDALKTQVSETKSALDMAQQKIEAYKQEGEAYKEKALGMLGFSDFRSRWQQDMLAGQKERFAESNKKQSDPGEKQVQELVKLNKDLTDRLDKLNTLLKDAVTVGA